MNRAARIAALLALSAGLAGSARAQGWDAPEARELLARAIERRRVAFADTALRDWSARAHGFVFFLGQIGEGLSEPPRLIKSDQLEVEVYWESRGRSRQRVIGWRDRRDLPTDINYHRDHLGIVMNNFPDFIRLGDGDEVRDVPHPVSAAGEPLYEFAPGDTLVLQLPGREIRVVELKFRPRDFRQPRIVGSAFLDLAGAEVVRMSFTFTAAAYRDDQLEDLTVSVENSLWSGRWWLPLRQEIEIRRRATWMEFPARGIIRGRWEIDSYRFNEGLDPALFHAGPEIVIMPREIRDTFPWELPLDAAIRDIAIPARLADFDAVRAEATRIAAGNLLSGLSRAQVAGGSVSDFVHVNRVEGLALGAGVMLRSADQARTLRLAAGFATDTALYTASARFTTRRGTTGLRLTAAREVRDIGEIPVISRALNSLFAQEGGADFGDYFLATGATLGVSRALGSRGEVLLEAGVQRIDSLVAAARWARGEFRRPNPGVDEGSWWLGRLALRQEARSFATSTELTGRLEIEAASGPTDYARLAGNVRMQLPAGAGSVLLRASAGAATAALPRHRAFVLGGRGTILGEPYRGLSGRQMAWASGEWQLKLPVPQLMLGTFAGTGARLTVAPWAAAGWTGGAISGFPGRAARGPDGAIGVGFGWLHDLVRLDVGYGLRSSRVSFAVDVNRDFWGIL
jgi:hypothetical protein